MINFVKNEEESYSYSFLDDKQENHYVQYDCIENGNFLGEIHFKVSKTGEGFKTFYLAFIGLEEEFRGNGYFKFLAEFVNQQVEKVSPNLFYLEVEPCGEGFKRDEEELTSIYSRFFGVKKVNKYGRMEKTF